MLAESLADFSKAAYQVVSPIHLYPIKTQRVASLQSSRTNRVRKSRMQWQRHARLEQKGTEL